MTLYDSIKQSKNYSTEFDTTLFFIKNWENNRDIDISKIEISAHEVAIYLSNNRSASIQIYKERLYISHRDQKTGKITNKSHEPKEQHIKYAMNQLFELS